MPPAAETDTRTAMTAGRRAKAVGAGFAAVSLVVAACTARLLARMP